MSFTSCKFVFYLDVSGSENEEGAAALEEKEALAMQQKIAEELDEQDFGLDIFKVMKSVMSLFQKWI